MLNGEVKEGEILPPTIQRLMKGYNKYLRPFFDSKETADALSLGKCVGGASERVHIAIWCFHVPSA